MRGRGLFCFGRRMGEMGKPTIILSPHLLALLCPPSLAITVVDPTAVVSSPLLCFSNFSRQTNGALRAVPLFVSYLTKNKVEPYFNLQHD